MQNRRPQDVLPPGRAQNLLAGCIFDGLACRKYFCVTLDKQCQLVKNFENRINSLNIGIKYHSEMNPGANGVDHAICRTVLLFDCMVKKQVCKMPAM